MSEGRRTRVPKRGLAAEIITFAGSPPARGRPTAVPVRGGGDSAPLFAKPAGRNSAR